jgi:uncharacterized protein (DUF302 family)
MAKSVTGEFDSVVDRVTAALKAEGFGIISDIDVRDTLKKKLGVDWRAYRILGACNPLLAHQALQVEDKIGIMLPCNVIVQDLGSGHIEVAAVDPSVAMARTGTEALSELSAKVRQLLQAALNRL